MSDVPRRLRPGYEKRIRTSVATKGASSARGSTLAAAAVPVQTSGGPYQESVSLNVVTGDSSGTDSISITSTSTGTGSSVAADVDAVAVGAESEAWAAAATSLGWRAKTYEANAIAIGFTTASRANAIAIGANEASGLSSIAIGDSSEASGDFAVAIGQGAVASTDNEIRLGAASAIAVIEGKLVIKDSSGGGYHQIVCSSGGVLSTVAYP